MGKGSSPWRDGRRAWERLHGWHQDTPEDGPGHPDTGAAALDALADVGLVRRLLDQAELVAVRTARRHGKSWAEIATRLGVTRQSAWERWRDLDEAEHPPLVENVPTEGPPTGHAPAGQTPIETVVADVAGELLDRAARRHRRRSSVVVPNVVGMSWDDARQRLIDVGLVPASPDPDGPPLAAAGWPNAVVSDQSPESGAKVPPGSPVRLWLERGGGSAGVREPRRPKPSPKSGWEMRDEPTGEPTDEAVG